MKKLFISSVLLLSSAFLCRAQLSETTHDQTISDMLEYMHYCEIATDSALIPGSATGRYLTGRWERHVHKPSIPDFLTWFGSKYSYDRNKMIATTLILNKK